MAMTLTILGLALATFLLRYLPLAALSRTTLPPWAEDWLRLVPGAVLAASLAQALLYPDDALWIAWNNPYLFAAVPTFLVARRTRSVLRTMLTGMACYALLTAVL